MSDQNRNSLPKAQNTNGEGPSKPAAASETNGAAGSRPRPRPRPNARDATTEDAQKPPVQSGPPEQSNGIATDPAGKDPPAEDSGGCDPTRPIGYGNPPRKDAYRPGEGSPNPGGKRKLPGPEDVLFDILCETVPGSEKVWGQALMRQLVASAVAKDRHAVQIVIDLWAKRSAASGAASETNEDDYKRLLTVLSGPAGSATVAEINRKVAERAKADQKAANQKNQNPTIEDRGEDDQP